MNYREEDKRYRGQLTGYCIKMSPVFQAWVPWRNKVQLRYRTIQLERLSISVNNSVIFLNWFWKEDYCRCVRLGVTVGQISQCVQQGNGNMETEKFKGRELDLGAICPLAGLGRCLDSGDIHQGRPCTERSHFRSVSVSIWCREQNSQMRSSCFQPRGKDSTADTTSGKLTGEHRAPAASTHAWWRCFLLISL